MGDLISREALMEFASNHVGHTIDCNDIARFPAVDAEPVRYGKWIFDNHACGYYMSGSVCSVCKGGALSNSAYCPHCGAKMDGGAEDGRNKKG